MQKMMTQLGMNMDELDAAEVIIVLNDGSEIRVTNPKVVRMKMQGQESFQVSGDIQDADASMTLEVGEDDISMVVSQAGVSAEDAQKALEDSGGDIAKAILDLSEEENAA